MEPTVNKAILGGSVVEGIRELNSTVITATFDAGFADAAIEPTTVKFVNDANKKLLQLFATNPLEAPKYEIGITGFDTYVSQKYVVDFSTLRILSPVESEAQVFRLTGAPNFEKTARGVTMQLLKDKMALTAVDFKKVPYIVESRKRYLEQQAMAMQLLMIQKSIFDEIFKMVNICGDILSGAAVLTIPAALVAIENLLMSWIQLSALVKKTIQLVQDNRELFLPAIRHHLGINLFTYLTKGCDYLNIDIEFGNELEEVLKKITLLGSKSDEMGDKTTGIKNVDIVLGLLPNAGDGLLRPSDYGYTLGEAFELVKKIFNCKSAIQNNVYHLRAKKDPFWLNAPSHVMPSVLIEEALGYSNGSYSYNYDELVSRYLISYAKDDSDYFTITDVNNRMAEVIYDHPMTDKKASLLKGLTEVEIPYSLCVRKPSNDGIFDNIFLQIGNLIGTYAEEIETIYDSFPALQQVAPGLLDVLNLDFWDRGGALLVENHFFSKPKIIYQDDNGKIPIDFASKIGGDALWTNWHSFNCMAKGFKDPTNPNKTNQKKYFKNIKIPFGIKDYEQTIINSNCIIPNYGEGEYQIIRWDKSNDFAIVDFFIYFNWANELTAKLYKIGVDKIGEGFVDIDDSTTTTDGNPGV